MRHGEQKGIYSTKGIQIAIEFLQKMVIKLYHFYLIIYLKKKIQINMVKKESYLIIYLTYMDLLIKV